MLSHLCLLVLIGCAVVMSQEQAPSTNEDFEQKLAVAIEAFKEVAKELEAGEGSEDISDQSLKDYLSSPSSRRSNVEILRKSRDFWEELGKAAQVVGSVAGTIALFAGR
uniref:Secreted protein n=1 Tax=Biomphalaria glabrata TaxID=6526 RepID=A0A2C9LBY8_BIOGL